MAQFYTLEEAARVLGMNPEELKSKAQHREIRAFLDGGSWRFRVVDIDELARRRGLGQRRRAPAVGPGSPGGAGRRGPRRPGPLRVPARRGQARPRGRDDGPLRLLGPGASKPDPDSGSEHDILFDDLSVPPNPVTGSSSVIIGMQSSGKLPSDSDVRLVPDNVKGSSDSDVRLASPDPTQGRQRLGRDPDQGRHRPTTAS